MEQFQTLLSHQNFVHPNKTALPTEKKTELDKKKNRTAILTKENRNAIPTKKNGCSCFLRYPSNSAAHTKKVPDKEQLQTLPSHQKFVHPNKTASPQKKMNRTTIRTKLRYRQKL
jgi:hypothetical protein